MLPLPLPLPTRPLGNTGLQLTTLSFGASSLGAEFRGVSLHDALQSVRTAIESGMNFIDTSPYYGRGMSEVLLGQVLPEFSRSSYFLGTKLGRYAPQHFDFSAKRVAESVDVSLERMKADYCSQHGVDIAQLALQFAVANPDFTTCITGSANPARITQWVDWLQSPVDQQLLQDVREILKPIHNWFYKEGLPENNDVTTAQKEPL